MGQLADQIENTAQQLVPPVPQSPNSLNLLTGPGFLEIVGVIVAAIRSLEGIAEGASFHVEALAPGPTDGADGDSWLNGTTGDLFKKVEGVWIGRGNLKGAPGKTPVKGVDYRDGYTPQKGVDYRDGVDGKSAYQLWLAQGNTGTVAAFLESLKAQPVDVQNGKDGTIVFLETYAPDDAVGEDGNQWTYVNTETKTATFYKKIAGKWRLVGAPTGGATMPTTPTADTQSPNLSFTAPASGATVPVGTQLLLTATATDNVAVTAVRFLNGIGAVLGQGVKNGNVYTLPYTVTVAGPLSLVAEASDAAGNVQTATVNITVQAASVANQTPVSIAGADTTVDLAVATTVFLQGGGTDSDGTIVAYEWTQVTGPNNPSQLPAATKDVFLTGLIAGTYQFRLKVTDDKGATATDDRIVTAVPAASSSPTYTGTPLYLAFVGDSLTVGGIGNPATFTDSPIVQRNGGNASSYPPSVVEQTLLDNAYFKVFDNFGAGGVGIDYITNYKWQPQNGLAASGCAKGIIVLEIGTNDGFSDINGFATKLTNYISIQKAANLSTILISNTPPATNYAAWATYMRANWQAMGAVGFYDLLADSRAQDNTNETYYQTDHLHYRDSLSRIIAEGLKPVILGVANQLYPSGGGGTTTPAPAITALNPSTAKVGDSIVIAGSNLTGSTVKFTGASAVSPSANTATSITVTVPVGATSGAVTVSNTNGTSNALSFTLQAATTPQNLVEWQQSSEYVVLSDSAHMVTQALTTNDGFGQAKSVSRQIINISQDVEGEQANIFFPDSPAGSTDIVGLAIPGDLGNPVYGTYNQKTEDHSVYNAGSVGATLSGQNYGDGSGSLRFIVTKNSVSVYYAGSLLATTNGTVPPQLVVYFHGGSNGSVTGNPAASRSNVVLTGTNITTV